MDQIYDDETERLLYEEIVYVYFTRIKLRVLYEELFTCFLRGNDLRVLYDEKVYVSFTWKQLTWLLGGNGLRGFYEETVDPTLRRNIS